MPTKKPSRKHAAKAIVTNLIIKIPFNPKLQIISSYSQKKKLTYYVRKKHHFSTHKAPESTAIKRVLLVDSIERSLADGTCIINAYKGVLINPPWGIPLTLEKEEHRKQHPSSLLYPLKALNVGLIFIWVPKELISDLILYYEDHGFKYVDNIVKVEFDPKKCKGT
jgi:hypothetical protein